MSKDVKGKCPILTKSIQNVKILKTGIGYGKMIIRKATPRDAEAGDLIYREAKKYMRESDNPDQWRGEYPCGKDILSDIEIGRSYVCEDNGEIVAVFAFGIGEDESYKEIFDGAWKKDGKYGYIHRIAVKYHGRGIADFCFSECFKLCPNLKIDTHKDNIPMQKALIRAGFEYCGIIYCNDPTGTREQNRRVAYQKIK
jgi:RimJ/RimL family protein N-acetyltransferase